MKNEVKIPQKTNKNGVKTPRFVVIFAKNETILSSPCDKIGKIILKRCVMFLRYVIKRFGGTS